MYKNQLISLNCVLFIMIAVHSFLIPHLDPWWEAGFHLGSQVGGGMPPRIPGGRRDPALDPRLDPGRERWDPANNDRTPPESRLPFYLSKAFNWWCIRSRVICLNKSWDIHSAIHHLKHVFYTLQSLQTFNYLQRRISTQLFSTFNNRMQTALDVNGSVWRWMQKSSQHFSCSIMLQ